MARILVLGFLVLAGCTVTTTADDAFGNRMQTPPFWKMLPGTAFCVLQAREGFWKTHQEALLRTAESCRREGRDRPVFDLWPLARVRPDGMPIPRPAD